MVTPTNLRTQNKFAILAGFDDDDDEPMPPVQQPSPATRQLLTAISDTGATGHFLTTDAPVCNKQIAANPISILLPNGATLRSTHTCELAIPGLRTSATKAHVVPAAVHRSFL